MRREIVIVVAWAILASSIPALGAPGPTISSFFPHPPIVIIGDANFTAANGVVAGVGTPADPFVIAGWRITSTLQSGIYVYNTTAAFVIRDNLIEAPIGVRFLTSTSLAVIENNQFMIKSTGISAVSAQATIRDNSFVTPYGTPATTGVSLTSSNSIVVGNSFALVGNAVVSHYGSPVIAHNDIHHSKTAIYVRWSTAASIHTNTITISTNIAIDVRESLHVNVSGNILDTVGIGIELWGDKDVNVHNNTVRYAMSWGIEFESSSGNLTANVVIDGMADGVRIWHSQLIIANNTVSNNLGIGLHFMMSTSNVESNILVRNNIGIALNGDDVPHLRANLLVNNTVGFKIPYTSRQAIFHMEANIVNGVNVDGTLVPSQQVYFYKAANVTIQGQVRDSGFSAGYYGSLTAEGQVVLYEVDTANINASVLSHANVGVGIVNSFNVVVSGSLIVNTQVGIRAEAINVPWQVPTCVVSVKDSNVTIEIDPPATLGIDIRGCTAFLLRSNVSIVDTGIRFDALARGFVQNMTVHSTRVGLEIQGRPDDISVTGSAFIENRIGARFLGARGLVTDNRFDNNAQTGLTLEGGANLDFRRNSVRGNGEGLIDTRACAGSVTCSSIRAESNVFAENRGDGARINGVATFRSDEFTNNRGRGIVGATDTTLHLTTVVGNDGDGAVLSGRFQVRDATINGNGGHGANLVGSGDLWNGSFSGNRLAGVLLNPTRVWAFNINASHNLDGILFAGVSSADPTTIPSTPDILRLLPTGGVTQTASPFEVHRSTFFGNQRDAMRAGTHVVNATHNYWGSADGPALNIGDEIGAYRNGVSPYVRFVPYYVDPAMTTTGPVFLL